MARFSPRCTTLGPGVRAVIWVQGCPLRCRECVVPELLPFAGGDEVPVDQLARRIVELPAIDGVTFTGGEPMSQAGALSRLIDHVRRDRDLSFMSYTGWTIEHLERQATADQRNLLSRLDMIVDGPYLPEQHTDLKWRGSANQRVFVLGDRHLDCAAKLDERGRWLEFELTEHGTLTWMGIPPRGFRAQFAELLRQRGIVYSNKESEP